MERKHDFDVLNNDIGRPNGILSYYYTSSGALQKAITQSISSPLPVKCRHYRRRMGSDLLRWKINGK